MNDHKESPKRNDDNQLELNHKVKKRLILLSYQLKRLRRRFSLAYLLFIFSFVLFLLVLIPNLAHRMSLPGENWPLVLEIQGVTLARSNIAGQDNNLAPAPFVHIEIGGYSAVSASDGTFNIRFTSSTYSEIPVVLSWSNTTIVRWISFQPGQFNQKLVFTIE